MKLKTIALFFLALLTYAATAVEKPNIIFFYVDDLGWQDTQLNDIGDPCPYETPNIVKLAERGMNFTQGYSPAPTCAPSRAGIITGQHPAKIALTHVDLGGLVMGKKDNSLTPPYLPKFLDLNLLTIADAMKANGYLTGHSGKWHVGLTASSYGFEVVNQDRGVHRGMDDRTKDFATAEDKKYPLSKEKYPPFSEKHPEGISYPYDEVTESAIRFMAGSGEKPFFLNLCHWMVHWPMLTRNGDLLEYYCDKLGQPFPPEPGAITLPGQQNPYFASMVTTVDWSLGRIVGFLEKTDDPRNPGKKLIETTYIFFTSDNGGAEIKGKEILSDNAPLKYGKKHAEEGGVRVPMFIVGPGIKPSTQSDTLVNQLDYFPTVLSLTNATIAPEDHKELSGLDITPILHGKSDKITDASGVPRDHLFWHFPHNGDIAMKSSLRSGDFKLYKRHATNDYELYELYKNGKASDLSEQTNLAENPEYSATLTRMSTVLDAELKANNAEGPYLNPLFEGNHLPSAKITKSEYNPETRAATASVESTGPAIVKAWVIYRPENSDKKEKHKGDTSYPDDSILPGMRKPATLSEDGRSISSAIPENIPAYCFALIDENGYQQYSKVTPVK